ncbi:MAG: PAS domain S-box protein [Bacteroidota bacterium]
MPPSATSSPSLPHSHLDAFLPDALSLTERRRGRILVGASLLAVMVYAVGMALMLQPDGIEGEAVTGAAALVTLAALWGLRKDLWTIDRAAWIVFPVSTLTLVGVSWMDLGVIAPQLIWLGVVPTIAALAGGRSLAVACAAIAAVGVGAMWVRGLYVPFPLLTSAEAVAFIATICLCAAAAVGAWLGWLHEGAADAALAEQHARLTELTAALRSSEARYRTAIENMPVGVFQTSIDGEFQLANPALARIFGYSSLRAFREAGRLADDFYAGPTGRQRHLDRLAEHGSAISELDAVDAAGRPLRLRVHARARRGGGGSLIGVEGTIEDITARYQVTRTLEAREARFRALVQHTSDVVCVLDRDSRVTYASPSIQTTLGVKPDAALGVPIFDLLHPEDVARARALFQEPENGDDETIEFRLRHANGHYLFTEAIATSLFDDPAVEGLVVTFREITDRKRAEAVLIHAKEQAEEVARLKSSFLANMSHEIRTPLTGILGFADILADEVTDPEQKEFVDLILQSGKRLLDTLNSVLDLARLDAGRMELTSEPVLLADAARETARLLAPLADDKDLVLTADIEDEAARAEVDLGALNRILTNLVGNAIKFTKEGSITIGVRGSKSNVMIDVRDTGVGIDAEFLPNLFEEFRQESSGSRRSHEGSGLGLAITRQLAERMEGTVSVESEKGVGSTFTVTFPRANVAPLPDELRQARVLVVDDNEQTRAMASRMLETAYRVDTAFDMVSTEAAAATAAQANDPFDVILLDINLGTMDTGEDVMRRLREMPPYDARSIIAFTAYALPGDRERFLSEGFDGYFAKPFTRDTLLSAVADAMGSAPPPPPPPVSSAFVVRNTPEPRSDPGARIVLVPGSFIE